MESGLSDDAIIARVLGGDTDAYGLLFDRYQRYVARVVSKYIPVQDVEEVALEAFTRAFTKLETLEAQGAFRHWIATIATRLAYDHLRKRGRKKSIPISTLAGESRDWMECVLADAAIEKFGVEQEKVLAQEVLQHALGQLSAEDRMVICLVHLEEKSCKEAAQVLGWTEVNVRVRAMRARKTLRKIIESAM